MPKHHCCAYNCTNSKAKKKDPAKYPEVASVTFHCFPSNNEKKQYAPGMSEQEKRRRWIAACRLESLNVTRHTRICSKHFAGGLGPTKANPVPTIFDFPKHLQLLLEKPQTAEFHVRPEKIKDGLIYHDEAVQTDLTAEEITRMEQAPFKQRDELKRDLFMQDVQRDDSSVKFYTGLPSLSCLLMLFEFLKPVANCMKNWDG